MNAPPNRTSLEPFSAQSAGKGIELRNVSKAFGEIAALKSVSLVVGPDELLAVTGPSGAGKTTLCRVIAGLERPDAGYCGIHGRDMAAVKAGARRIAYMFESYALYPHLTVRENVLSPISAPGRQRDSRLSVDDLLVLLEIDQLADRLPGELSGGQKQRVAIARALIQQAAVALLDEPISHLDAKLRHRLRHELRRLLKAKQSPAIWCTPDAMEALSVGDRIAVIVDGRIEQVGTPHDVWTSPANVRVARLIGDPPINLISGRVEFATSGARFVSDALVLPLSRGLAEAASRLGSNSGVTLGVRPNLLSPTPAAAAGRGELYSYEPFGKFAISTIRLGRGLVKTKGPHAAPATIGTVVGLRFPKSGFILFDEKSGEVLASDACPAAGEPV
ncbi:MAG: ABC transporter ATP-binding protein [Hyphomicrobiaceae bacterium]